MNFLLKQTLCLMYANPSQVPYYIETREGAYIPTRMATDNDQSATRVVYLVVGATLIGRVWVLFVSTKFHTYTRDAGTLAALKAGNALRDLPWCRHTEALLFLCKATFTEIRFDSITVYGYHVFKAGTWCVYGGLKNEVKQNLQWAPFIDVFFQNALVFKVQTKLSIVLLQCLDVYDTPLVTFWTETVCPW